MPSYQACALAYPFILEQLHSPQPANCSTAVSAAGTGPGHSSTLNGGNIHSTPANQSTRRISVDFGLPADPEKIAFAPGIILTCAASVLPIRAAA